MDNNKISGRTGLICLLGSPVSHSRSPLIHNEAFRLLGLDYVYLCFDVDEAGLENVVKGLAGIGARGFNLTMPDKSAMCAYCDTLSDASRLTGSVNTVVIENGRLHGHTTDGVGYLNSVREQGCNPSGKVMTVLGGGGAAVSIIVQAALEGVSEIRIFNRKGGSFDRIERLIPEIGRISSCRITQDYITDKEMLQASLEDSYMLTNCTNVGMAPDTKGCLISDDMVLPSRLIVSDIIYEPSETALLRHARRDGCPAFNGEYMLLYQAAESFKLWTGREMPVETIKEMDIWK
ncbi:MAG: quinate/shikimate dehydrogenase [Lachnospiraceae bacterium]|nr:quinate/shikimate dehydrogenase [Lachnospiraceae bacterium]